MKKFKIIISLILIFAMFFSLAVISSRAVAIEEFVADTFFSWIAEKGLDYLSGKIAEEHGLNQSSDCSHDWHYAGSGTGSDGTRVGYYVCSICGQTMTADPDTVRTAYNQYVNELPAAGYDSEGGLLIEPTHDYAEYFFGGYGSYFGCAHHSSRPLLSSSSYCSGSFSCNLYSCSCSIYPKSGQDSFSFRSLRLYFSAEAPISGYYKIVVPVSVSGSLIYNNVFYPINKIDPVSTGYGVFYDQDSTISISFLLAMADVTDVVSGSVSFFHVTAAAPKLRIIPADSIGGQINLTYAPSTRVTNITGDVAYYDVNGTLQLAPNINIVNEGNKTYYNPVTNTTNVVNNWTYDYSDRSYTLELDTGDTVNVTYGDEYIRIEEDNRVYNVYYVTNNTTLPEAHTHEWYQTGAAQSTCTEYGTKTYTCYICNEQKTEVLPALGHAWVQSGRVDAVVDEEGNETEAAYILYIVTTVEKRYKGHRQRRECQEELFAKSASAKPRIFQ